MSQNPAYHFSVDKENKTITIKREFAAELPVVWDAYTKSEILDQWWAPKPWKSETKSMDFKEGGRWLYAMVGPNGEKHWAVVNYKNVQPQKKFVALDAFTDDKGNINTDLPQAEWEMVFTGKGQSTLVESVIHYNSVEDIEKIVAMGFKEGLEMAMVNLDELLPSLKKK